MPNFADGKIEAYVGPPGLGGADALEAVIGDFIAGARRKLDIAIQELDSDAIARAILAASWRGVCVTLFLEQDYLRTSLKRDRETHVPIAPLPPQPGETPEQALERVQWQQVDTDLSENRRILAALLRSDVEVRGDFNPKLFHQKFVLRDYINGKATSPATRRCSRARRAYLDRHPREPQQHLRLSQLPHLAPVRARVQTAQTRQLRPRTARRGPQHL